MSDYLALTPEIVAAISNSSADDLVSKQPWLGLTEQTRTVMGQEDDGTPNGKDYTERRLVSEWAALTPGPTK